MYLPAYRDVCKITHHNVKNEKSDTHFGVVLFFFLTAGGDVAGAAVAPSAASSPEFPGPDMDLFIANRIDMAAGGVVQV